MPNLLDEKNRRSELCHGLSSCGKAFNTWLSQETLYECRKACGGLGYSAYNVINSMMQNNDIQQTWEGDNNVLLQ